MKNRKVKPPVMKLIWIWVMALVFVGLGSLTHAVEVGVKGGYQSVRGLKAGVFFGFDLVKNFQFQPEIYFSQRKYSYEVHCACNHYAETDEAEIEFYDTVKFVEVPVLFKYRVDMNGPFKPVVFAGGYLAKRVSKAPKHVNDYFYPEELDCTAPNGILLPDRDHNETDVGLVLGTGFEYGINSITLIVDFRVNIGFSKVLEYEKLDCQGFSYPGLSSVSFDDEKETKKTRSISCMIGVRF